MYLPPYMVRILCRPLIRHITRIGSNLNQIARHANTEKQLDNQVLQALAQTNALLDQLVAQAEQD